MSRRLAKLTKPLVNRIVGHGEEAVDQLLANPLNYRLHPDNQQHALAGSIDDIGFVRSVTVNRRTGHVVDGHLRVTLAARSGVETLPVEYVDLSEAEEAQALLSLDPIAAMAASDRAKLDELMRAVQSDDERVQQMLADLAEREKLYTQPKPEGKPNPRNLPIDVIYTLQMADCTCCLAVQAGLKYGIQSAHYRLCPYTHELSGRHEVAFIDNDYFNYEHSKHLAAVKELKPKYATVRDVMTEEQCAAAGMEYYSLGVILEWAEELAEYAENVIVIPKYDCLDKIPDKFMLGYSVPTSHGGTPLPVEMFKGRRIHLLGGSWKNQLAHMAALGDDVVSLDTNYVQNIAKQWGEYIDPEGELHQMKTEGYGYLTNVRYAALALSFGAIGAKVNELTGNKNPADESGAEGEIANSYTSVNRQFQKTCQKRKTDE